MRVSNKIPISNRKNRNSFKLLQKRKKKKTSNVFKCEVRSEKESIKSYFTIETYDVIGTQEQCGCLKLYPATSLQAAINKVGQNFGTER